MRLAAGRLEGSLLGGAELQRLAPIDRRQPPRQQHLAAKLELLRRLVAGVEHTRRLQPLDRRGIGVEAGGLMHGDVGAHAQPMQILLDLVGIFLARARDIGVVEPQHEAAAVLQREQPVEQGGARIADMDVAGRRRRETYGDGHRRRGSEGRGRWQAARPTDGVPVEIRRYRSSPSLAPSRPALRQCSPNSRSSSSR